MRKTRKERRKDFIESTLAIILTVAVMFGIGLLFLKACEQEAEQTITYYDHLEDFKLWHAYENCPTLRY